MLDPMVMRGDELSGGCACNASESGSFGMLGLLLVGLFLFRRR